MEYILHNNLTIASPMIVLGHSKLSNERYLFKIRMKHTKPP